MEVRLHADGTPHKGAELCLAQGHLQVSDLNNGLKSD